VTSREPLAPVGRTIGIARPVAWAVVATVALGSAAVGAAIGLMAASAWLLSRAAGHPPEAALTIGIVLVQVFGLSRGPLRYGERLVGHHAAFGMLASVRVRLYGRLERLAPAGLPAFRSGDLMARLVADVDAMQDVVVRIIPAFAVAASVGVATVLVVWWLLPAAALVLALALFASAVPVTWLTGFLARRRESGMAALRGELAAAVVDLVEGAPELAVYGATDAQLERIDSIDRDLARVARSSAATAGIGLGLTTFFSGAATWGVLLVGVPAVRSGRLDGVWLGSLALVPLAAFELVSGLPAASQALHRVRASAERLFAIADAPDVVAEPSAPTAPPVPPVDLEVRSVWAGYPPRSDPAGSEPGDLRRADPLAHAALRGVDLDLPAGKRIGIVGPSGAGKTSLAWVLVDFLPVRSGSVTLEGTSFAWLEADDVRALVGLVSQESHLFDASLADNLRVARRDASDDELLAVLERVGLGRWFEGLAHGLATEVGRFGARLSGGERQRVAVARALLATFSVLVLDEPAEHLDIDAADALTRDLLALTAGRSTVLLTHRLAGLEAVDEIIVLDGGRVVERGTHRELLASGANYAALFWSEANADRAASELLGLRGSESDRTPTEGS
jgi:thiol reductant ABC exporter CydC subunit